MRQPCVRRRQRSNRLIQAAKAGCVVLGITPGMVNGWQQSSHVVARMIKTQNEYAAAAPSEMPRRKRRRSSRALRLAAECNEGGDQTNATDPPFYSDGTTTTDKIVYSTETAAKGDNVHTIPSSRKINSTENIIDGETRSSLKTNVEKELSDLLKAVKNVTSVKSNVPIKGGGVEEEAGKHDRDFLFVCRLVASSDGKLPTDRSLLPLAIQKPPYILEKLDAIYHAISHDETRRLPYMERPAPDINENATTTTHHSIADDNEEKKLVSVLRNSLEDAGFELLSRRDLDLCQALNAGYLLRLSISPEVSGFDPRIAEEFYPEQFASFENKTSSKGDDDWWPFEGRVLVYRRGYSSEVTRGRLLVPKLDYLQTRIVQQTAFAVTEKLGQMEQRIGTFLSSSTRKARRLARSALAKAAEGLPSKVVAEFIKSRLGWNQTSSNDNCDSDSDSTCAVDPFFKLNRYGGRQRRFMGSALLDPLTPFMTCEVEETDAEGDPEFPPGARGLSCEYDANASRPEFDDPGVLLERVTLKNVVDLSARDGRRNSARRLFSPCRLVEPTYSEVVAIWRPLPVDNEKKKLRPPKVAYDLAEIFEIDDRLPKPNKESELQRAPLEIRTYDDVPMANVAAVLPKTKLLFRPADAFVFDLISVLGFVAVFTSQRFDSPKLDLLAVVSVSLWLIRTVLRYSNKLARYDLLVKTFLTSKISHRNSGALKYIAREAGTQRATRASLVYVWLVRRMSSTNVPLTREKLVREGAVRVNDLFVNSNTCVRVDVDAALNDLEDLNLIRFWGKDEDILRISDEEDILEVLRTTWTNIFDGRMSLKSLIGRREHPKR